jgi:hypothetical protein
VNGKRKLRAVQDHINLYEALDQIDAYRDKASQSAAAVYDECLRLTEVVKLQNKVLKCVKRYADIPFDELDIEDHRELRQVLGWLAPKKKEKF